MSQLLRVGDTVTLQGLKSGHCTVKRFLGGGAQGEVYEAALGNHNIAVKWYFPDSATPAQKQALRNLIDRGSPAAEFLWPFAIAESPARSGFGYAMPLREARVSNIVDLMKGRVAPEFRALATAGFNLAHSFLELHGQGYAYRDINFGNVFFDASNGDVLIADNDNVAINGAPVQAGGVIGTPRFMAPEIVRGQANPTIETDLYSLAVLLFYMFFVHHPLEGEREVAIHCLDWPAMVELYGTNPVFIFDPNDDTNRPVPGIHDNPLAFAPLYPRALKRLFEQSFTDGLHDPKARVRESEWRRALVELRDVIFRCPQCNAENFVDYTRFNGRCWSCAGALQRPMALQYADGRVVALTAQTQLFEYHLTNRRVYEFKALRGSVVQHPSNPLLWGVKNHSQRTWTRTSAAGEVVDVPPGKSAALEPGARINFGEGAVATVEA